MPYNLLRRFDERTPPVQQNLNKVNILYFEIIEGISMGSNFCLQDIDKSNPDYTSLSYPL